MLRKMLLLPFLFGCGTFGADCFEPAVGGSGGVSDYVARFYCLACRACGGARRWVPGRTSCGVRIERSFADYRHLHRRTLPHPSPRLLNSFARPIVFRTFFFKIRKHMPSTESRPQHPRLVFFASRLCFHKRSIFLSGSPVKQKRCPHAVVLTTEWGRWPCKRQSACSADVR